MMSFKEIKYGRWRPILVFMLWFVCTNVMYGQAPSSRYQDKPTPLQNITELRDRLNGVSILVGYEHPHFLNPIFVENVGRDYKRSFNYFLGGRFTTFPFTVEAIYFNDAFKVKSIPGVEIDDVIRHRGFEFSIGAIPLPFNNISKVIHPRAGLGYQYSQLCLHCSKTSDDPDSLEVPFSAIGTSGVVGKFGLSIVFRNISLETEIKQSINLQSRYSLFQWRAGIAIRPIITTK